MLPLSTPHVTHIWLVDKLWMGPLPSHLKFLLCLSMADRYFTSSHTQSSPCFCCLFTLIPCLLCRFCLFMILVCRKCPLCWCLLVIIILKNQPCSFTSPPYSTFQPFLLPIVSQTFVNICRQRVQIEINNLHLCLAQPFSPFFRIAKATQHLNV